jgi:transposase
LKEVVLVGDRGTLTKARIEELKKLPGVSWISALRGPAIRKLANEGSIQLSLFDQRNLAEITSPEYPGERLVVCLNPHVAEKRARTRIELLEATEKALAKVVERVAAGRLVQEDKIGEQVGRVCNRYKVAKHFEWTIEKGKLSFSRKQAPIDQEAALDGIYVIRTQLPAEAMEAAQVVRSYKRLARVESNFRVIKGPDLQVAPIRHRLTERIRAHFLICLLADYVRWHMERDLAPLLFKDEAVPFPEDPVAPAQRSNAALRKVSRKHNAEDLPVSSFRGLLDELATLTKNLVVAGGNVRFFQMTPPTPLHLRAFQLLDLKLPVAKKPLLSAS